MSNKIKVRPELKRLNKLLDKMEMSQALSASDDPRLQAMSQMLQGRDPLTGIYYKEIDRLTIGNICARLGVTYKMATTAYRDFKRSEAVVVAAQQLPQMVSGIMEDALNKDQVCETCRGEGKIMVTLFGEGGAKIEKTNDCIVCEGKGRIIKSGDPVARKQILEMMELAGKGITNINAHDSNVVVATEESLEAMLKKARGGANGNQNLRTIVEGGSGEVGEPSEFRTMDGRGPKTNGGVN